jgi:hypothetical protein
MFVYLACPYTKGNVIENVRRSMRLFEHVANYGLLPFNPLLSHFQNEAYERDYQWWINYDLEILKRCSAIIRLSGESKGADLEVAFATIAEMPIYILPDFNAESLYKLDEFLLYIKEQQ